MTAHITHSTVAVHVQQPALNRLNTSSVTMSPATRLAVVAGDSGDHNGASNFLRAPHEGVHASVFPAGTMIF